MYVTITSELTDDFKLLLEPAARRGGVDTLLDKHEVLWAAYQHFGTNPMAPPEPRLIGAATTRLLPEEKAAEVSLVGGVGAKKWIPELDRLIGEWAKTEGMTKLCAQGRAGWAKILNWEIIGSRGGVTAFEREL